MEKNVRGKNTRRKHLSKNKKKSWRKVDTKELDDFLEDERLQERTGGIVAEKPDESLFFVDKQVAEKKPAETRLAKKRKVQEKLKDVEVGLQPPPPKKKDKRAPAILEKEASGKVSNKEKCALEQRKQVSRTRNQRLRTRMKQPTAHYDLWEDEKETETVGEHHYRQVTKKMRIKAPERLQKPASMVPAVEAPHPGTSYNPDYDEYQDLCQKAVTKELSKIKEEEKIERALDAQFPSSKDAPSEKTHLTEMSEGLFHNKDDEDSDVIDDEDLDKLSVNPPVRRENKKDEKKRKKEKELKEQTKLAKKEKLKRIKENNFYRLKSIKAEIKKGDALEEEKAKKKAVVKAGEPWRTKRLSRKKYEEADLDLKLSEELVGTLREVKPEGHLLLDRFHSYMKRNMLEVRGSAGGKKPKRKYKPKVFEKRSHRDVK